MNDTFMKERPVFPLLMSMALPMVLSMLVNALYNIVDAYYVADICDDAMTALSLVYPVQNLINAVAIGFGIGINAAISRSLGAQERDRAAGAASWGLVLSVLHGLLMAAVCLAVMPRFLSAFTSSAAVIDLGLRYAGVTLLFAPVVSLNLAMEKIFQSVGRMRSTMLCLLFGCVTNILLDPILIFGRGPVPAMGIRGAAIATVIGQTLPVAAYFAVYLAADFPVKLGRRYLVRDRRLIGRLYAVGVPATLSLSLPSVLVSSLNAILAAFSERYVLVLGAYYKLQTFLYLTANGIVQGMRPLMGYNRGAGELGRVRQIYRTALGMSAAIMALGTVICLAVPERLIGLFSDSPETIAAGGQALRLISAGFVVSAVSVTSAGALEGLGRGTSSLVISLCRYMVVILPLAYGLSRVWGPVGVWNAFWLSEAVTAAAAAVIYRREFRQCAGS